MFLLLGIRIASKWKKEGGALTWKSFAYNATNKSGEGPFFGQLKE